MLRREAGGAPAVAISAQTGAGMRLANPQLLPDGDLAIFWQRANATNSAERPTRPAKGASHLPLSWSPSDWIVLFSAVAGTDPKAL